MESSSPAVRGSRGAAACRHHRHPGADLLEQPRREGAVPTGFSDFHGPTHKQFSRWGAYDTYGLGEPRVPPRA